MTGREGRRGGFLVLQYFRVSGKKSSDLNDIATTTAGEKIIY